jgi:hypothetical protein
MAALLAFMASLLRSQISLSLDNVALRHQLAVYKHTVHRPRLRPIDRLFWIWLSRLWPGWQEALAFVHLAHKRGLQALKGCHPFNGSPKHVSCNRRHHHHL